jgi:hypothetical protein
LAFVADAKGFDQPEVLVLAVDGLDGAEEHGGAYMTLHVLEYSEHFKGKYAEYGYCLALHFVPTAEGDLVFSMS